MIPIDTVVKPWGKVSMIRTIEGERYYFLIDEDGHVSMIPDFVVEHEAKSLKKEAK